jgi:GcrA cell cycle regulator
MWSEERFGLAAQWWREGATAAEIAHRLGGVTRNGVIGKLARRGITRTAAPRKSKPPVTARAVRERRAAVRKEKRIVEKPQPVEPLDIPFLQAKPGQCRAVTDATRFEQRICGHPADEGGVYCAAHRALFYQRTPAKAQ